MLASFMKKKDLIFQKKKKKREDTVDLKHSNYTTNHQVCELYME